MGALSRVNQLTKLLSPKNARVTCSIATKPVRRPNANFRSSSPLPRSVSLRPGSLRPVSVSFPWRLVAGCVGEQVSHEDEEAAFASEEVLSSRVSVVSQDPKCRFRMRFRFATTNPKSLPANSPLQARNSCPRSRGRVVVHLSRSDSDRHKHTVTHKHTTRQKSTELTDLACAQWCRS